jgi:hypothetical protein
MSDYSILMKIILSTQNQPTEKTQHFRGEEKIAVPDSLQIVKYPDDVEYYLLYLDKEGNELTDTYHDQLEDALAQAEWEFSVSPEQWEILEIVYDLAIISRCLGSSRYPAFSRNGQAVTYRRITQDS